MFNNRKKQDRIDRATRLLSSFQPPNRNFTQAGPTRNPFATKPNQGSRKTWPLGEFFREASQVLFDWTGASTRGQTVISVPVDEAALAWLDLIVDATTMEDRGEAAAFLMGEGFKATRSHLTVLAQHRGRRPTDRP